MKALLFYCLAKRLRHMNIHLGWNFARKCSVPSAALSLMLLVAGCANATMAIANSGAGHAAASSITTATTAAVNMTGGNGANLLVMKLTTMGANACAATNIGDSLEIGSAPV